MNQSGIAIELRDVVKQFGEVTAVDHVSLDIRDGEFFSMLGPSGCGKTTTLRMIAGFEFPTAGDIVLHGQSIGNTPPFRRNVNTVFQSYVLFPHMSVAENVAFGLQMKRRPRQLSGGQQQRVALARALVNHPEVLLLDEPLGALDQKLRKEMQIELKRMQEQVGITFIFVTHDQEEALTMSDRIAVMHHGRVLQVGTPTEIYERPNCRFVADFIGDTNFIDGHVAALNGEHATLTTADGLTVHGRKGGALSTSGVATVSVRPEKARLTIDAPAEAVANTFEVTVDRIAYIGSDTRILVRLGRDRLFSVWEQNSRSTLDRDAYWQPGERAFLGGRADTGVVWGI